MFFFILVFFLLDIIIVFLTKFLSWSLIGVKGQLNRHGDLPFTVFFVFFFFYCIFRSRVWWVTFSDSPKKIFS